jgi:hypothetical protein
MLRLPNPPKAANRISLNSQLLPAAIGIFFITVNLRSEILLQKAVAIQLSLAIPLLLTSTLAYSKLGYREKVERWNVLGWVCFAIAYSFIINVIGILLANIVGKDLSTTFFLTVWSLAFIYSMIDVSYDRKVLKERFIKDFFVIFIQVSLGLFVALGYY